MSSSSAKMASRNFMILLLGSSKPQRGTCQCPAFAVESANAKPIIHYQHSVAQTPHVSVWPLGCKGFLCYACRLIVQNNPVAGLCKVGVAVSLRVLTAGPLSTSNPLPFRTVV